MVQISYVRFKKRLLTFAKFVEIVERSRLKRVFFIFHSEDTLKLCFDFNKSQPIYSWRCYTYIKKLYTQIQIWAIFLDSARCLLGFRVGDYHLLKNEK